MGRITIVVLATAPSIDETVYKAAKTAITNALTAFNTANPNVNLSIDTVSTQYLAIG